MTPRQLFEMVVELETDLADFYLEIGQLYQSIADHYRKLAETCNVVSNQFETLATEEFGHRDYILDNK